MKHIIYTTIITILFLHLLSMRQSNEVSVPIYNRIIDKQLTSAIESFVTKHKGTDVDKNSKFLHLYVSRDSIGYHAVISHMPDSAHNSFVRHPIVVCKPIAGKKIFVDYDFRDIFISSNIPEASLYFKEDCPNTYRNYVKRYNDLKYIIDYAHDEKSSDTKDILDYTHDTYERHGPSLSLTFDYNSRLVDSVYQPIICEEMFGEPETEKEPKYIVTKITNNSIISVIENFIERGRGTALDSMSSYLYLKHYKSDSLQYYLLRHANEGDLMYCYNKPMLICSEISGKRVLFEIVPLNGIISMNNNMLLFLKEEHPSIYERSREYFDIVKNEYNKGWIVETLTHISYRQLEFHIDNAGRLVDSTYLNYNRI